MQGVSDRRGVHRRRFGLSGAGRQYLPRGGFTACPEAVRSAEEVGKATTGYRLEDPEQDGVAEFDAAGNCLSIEEKPAHPQVELRRGGAVLLPQQGSRRQIHPSLGARRTGDHLGEPGVSRHERRGVDSPAGIRMARHGHARLAGRSLIFVEVIEKRQG